jgi:hyperosmotically inducible periplasmic protein
MAFAPRRGSVFAPAIGMKSTIALTRLALIIVLAAMCGPAMVSAQSKTAGIAVKDAWITTQVHAKYFADPNIKGRNIDVDTENGVVTLSGAVYSDNERRQAIAKAKSTEGVSRVVDKLALEPGLPPISAEARDPARAEWPKLKADSRHAVDRLGADISDAWITTKVQSKFYLDSDVKGRRIDVTTTNGIVTLVGTVSGPKEKARALSLAKETDGVKEVVNKLVEQ